MMAGAAAASPGFRGSSDEFGPAFEAKGGDLFGHLAAVTPGALDFCAIIEDDLFKVFIAFGTMKFKNGHTHTPF